jgi:uncharacterized protein YndB with AHSA1/START domain
VKTLAAAPTSRCTEDTIVAEVVIAAPRELVWRALTDGRLLATWWGSDDTYRATGDWQLDLRPGGHWECHGSAADGTRFSVGGAFVGISPTDRLVMNWEPSWDPTPPTTLDYELTDGASGTRLRLTHAGFAGYAASRDSHAKGWVRVLGWLAAFAERTATITDTTTFDRRATQ